MIRRQLSTAALLLILVLPAAGVSAELPASIKVSGQDLRLNGQGTRSKYLMNLYAAGLYLPAPSQQAQAIIEADQLMSIRIAITSKLVTQERLVESLQEGFEKSTGGDLRPIQAQTQQFRQCFADPIVRGDVFDLIYSPGLGVTVYKNGQRKGVVAGLPFKKALFAIWLGDCPADARLRQALLSGGRAAQR